MRIDLTVGIHSAVGTTQFGLTIEEDLLLRLYCIRLGDRLLVLKDGTQTMWSVKVVGANLVE